MSGWKAGGKAMVEIAHISASGGINLCRAVNFFIDPDVLRPLPTDPHQALKDAVIAAAQDWCNPPDRADDYGFILRRRVNDLIDAQKPDPLEVFYAAAEPAVLCNPAFWEECRSNPSKCRCRINIAVGLDEVRKMESK